MKIWALSNHSDDDGRLTNTEDAEFLAGKIKPGHVLDFSGVVGVSAGFLSRIFALQPVGVFLENLVGAGPEVKGALDALLANPAPQVTPEPPRARPVPTRPPAPPEPAFERTVEARHRYTPSRLVAKLRDQLTHYIESA